MGPDEAVPALADAPRAWPLRARQRADPVLAGVPLAGALVLDVAAAVGGAGAVPIFSLLWVRSCCGAPCVGWRSTPPGSAWARPASSRTSLESVRLVSRTEAMGIPPRVSRRPPWGPPSVLVVLLRDDGRRYHGEPHRRTALLSVPAPVDLTELRRALPPV